MASALGFFVQSFAQKHAPPARTALILASEPAFAGLFGWLLNDERLTATGWLGRRAHHGGDPGGRARAALPPAAAAAGGLMYRLLLAVPFLIGVAVLQGLTVEIDTFHGSDSGTYQLPTILQLFRERLDFSNYPSAQTPLFHVVMTGWGELVGFELWKLRLLNVVISYGAALALLRLLRRTTPARPRCRPSRSRWPSCCRPTSSGRRSRCSPTTWRSCSRCSRSSAYTRTRATARPPPSPWPAFASRGPCSRASRSCGSRRWRRSSCCAAAGRCASGRAAALGLALLPLAALVIEWNGLVPPSADPASCGLCTDRPGVGRDALTLRTVGFTVALLGVYAAIVLGPATWRRIRLLRSPAGRLARSALGSPAGQALAGALRGERPRRLALERVIALAAAVGVLLLLIAPLEYRPVQPGIPGDAG